MAKRRPSLPSKPSKLIRVALADLEKVERDSKYYVSMDMWHEPDEVCGSECAVCFAGSVIAMSLKASRRKSLDPQQFPRPTRNKLYGLNEFRQGSISAAFDMMRLEWDSRLPRYVDVTSYEVSPRWFKVDMRNIATLLEWRGH